jgi:hypothetical protein
MQEGILLSCSSRLIDDTLVDGFMRDGFAFAVGIYLEEEHINAS